MADVSLLELLPRLFLSMAIVIVVMFIAARVMKNRNVMVNGGTLAIGAKPAAKKAKKAAIEVISRQGLGRNASVSVVRAGDKYLVLGVSETNVSLLTELDGLPEESTEDVATPSGRPALASVPTMAAIAPSGEVFKSLLEQARERTIRRTS